MKSIRAKIMWLLFISVLVASLVIGTLGITLTSSVIQESSTENMNLLCKNNADKIDVIFAKIEESVTTLVHYAESELPDVNLLKDDEFRKEYSAGIQKNALHHIESVEGAAAVYMHYDPDFIGDTDGFFYVRYENQKEFEYRPLTDISSLPPDGSDQSNWWYVPTVSGSATWFEAYFDTNLERYVVSYVVPIYKDDILIGVIGADILSEYIEDLVKEVSIFNSGQAAVLKSDGTVLYHPHFDKGMLIGEGDPGFDGVIEKLKKENNTKELISYQLNGVKKKLSSCKLKNGMLMVCFAPESEIFQRQNALMLANIIITAFVVVAASFSAFLLSKKLANPIKKLNEAAKHLTDEDYDFDIKVNSSDEIGELTTTFIQTRNIIRNQIYLLDSEAHRDGLTLVGNKSAYMDRESELNQEIAQGTADFSIVVLDVNKLKIANDVFGHMAGDKLLFTVATQLAMVFDAANVYRLGGDEFVVIIPKQEGVDSREKIESCVADMKKLTVEGYPECKVSCAYGFSELDKKDTQLSDVLRRADKEMYKNKNETKKETFPWQEGEKGVKQLQVEKYCELLQSLKESTDDYLILMNIETGYFRLFGTVDNTFNITDGGKLSDGIDELLKFIHVNDRDLIKQAAQSVISRDTEKINISFRMQSNDNSMHWANCRASVIKDEMDAHFVLIGRISQNAVKHLYNNVTTLFNKTKLKLDFQGDLFDKFAYLMLIDVDKLSEINLKHGSEYGDELLASIANELEKRFDMWQIYHAEKDRFVVLFDHKKNRKDIDNEFEAIKQAVSDKCSVSAAVVPNDTSLYVSADNIYDYAVQILNDSKKDGIGQIIHFSKERLLESLSTVELLEELEDNVRRKNCSGFHLVYQPQIKVDDYSISSAETLLRFKSETKGQVFPDQFIPILEQTGLIKEVGLWVADKALCQCKAWRKYDPNFKISVNVSPVQLEDKSIATEIIKLLKKHNLPGDALILEITESTQFDVGDDIFEILSKFRQAGVQIAIDDFGTGYSNLGNLKHIHANILKVDRVFIRDIKENGYNYNLIYNVLEFAKSNELKVCLEGVETKEELLVLSGLQADIFQGYLFDRPYSADIIEAKYFIKDSAEYKQRLEHIEQLSKEKRHAPIVNMEIKTILSGLNIGLWIIRIDTNTGDRELYTDDIMKKLLGVSKDISPKDCYTHWMNNIKGDSVETVNTMLSEMMNDEKIIQTEYLWNSPDEKGEILIRSSGRCTEKTDGIILLEGFHRAIN